MLRRDGAGSTGSPLSQPVGLDEREHLRTVGGEQHRHETRTCAKAGVGLQPGRAELEVCGRQDVETPIVEGEPEAGMILDDARGEAGKAPLHRIDRVGRREERIHVGLAKVERHSLDTLGMADWLAVPLDALDPDGRTLIEHEGHEIAVFRVDGNVYAVANSCPHEGNPLIEGIVLGGNLTCAYHAWTFDLATGSCLVGDEAARCYPVEVEDGVIRIGLPD